MMLSNSRNLSNCKASRTREMLRFMEAIGRAGVRERPA